MQKAVQDIMRQITATVTFLPAIEEKCEFSRPSSLWTSKTDLEGARESTGVFNILVYTDKDTAVPSTWQDSDPHNIAGNAEQVSSLVRTSVVSQRC